MDFFTLDVTVFLVGVIIFLLATSGYLYHQHVLLKQAFQQADLQVLEKSVALESLQNQLVSLQDAHFQAKMADARNIELSAQLSDLKNSLSHSQAALLESQQQHQLVQVTLAETQVSYQKDQQAHQEKLEILDKAKQQLSQEFQLLAQQILDAKQAQMTEQSRSLIGGMMQPMETAMKQFQQRVELVHKEDLEGRASLVEQLKQLQSLNAKMTDEARNLTHALKGDSKLQGNWGELILEKLLESSGLRNGVEFDREKVCEDEDGRRLRPDVILNLPGNKHIIIDSKVSLTAYELAVNSQSKEKTVQNTQAHLLSISRHIKALSEKSYQNLGSLNAPDFVLMFIPIEGAYLMAIEADASVFERAFEKKVAVVTPTTLFTTLKTIEQLWRYERQSEHTLVLVKRAAEVHDKFVGFIENFEKVGKQLTTVQGSFETARNQLHKGAGNLVRQAQMLKELAGKTKKDIPSQNLIDADDEEFVELLTETVERESLGSE